MDKISVLIVEPLSEPRLSNIIQLDEIYEKIVGGKYKTQRLDKKTVLVHNAKDKEQELVPNRRVGRDIICGKFIIAADNGDGKLASLTEEQAGYYCYRYMDAEVISQQEVKENMQYFGESIGKDEIYINNINMRINEFDFEKVAKSYKSPDHTEAKELLKILHEEFCDTFGTNSVDDLLDGDDVFIHIPVVMKSHNTGEICVGLVYVDTESSGELYNAQFALSDGFVSLDNNDKNNPMVQDRMRFGSFDYWFTVEYYDDIHSKQGQVPKEIKEILDYITGNEEQSMKMDGM